MQETDFKYEILIHDDASTDSSADIIREYEAKYPDIIKPIYQKENQYSKGVKISWKYQYPRAKGKYIAMCEGDDFWTDSFKLQKQFDILEKNPDCVFCSHYVRCVNEDGSYTKSLIPELNIKERLNSNDWIKLLCEHTPFQTCSYFFRREVIERFFDNIPEFIQVASIGDLPLMLLLATEGNCVFLKKEMSCYRCGSVGSWSRTQRNREANKKSFEGIIACKKSFDNYTNHKYSKWINESVALCEMQLHASMNKHRRCFQKKYRSAFRKLSTRTKISYVIFAVFPKLYPIYCKRRFKYD